MDVKHGGGQVVGGTDDSIISAYAQIGQAAEGIMPSRQFDISRIDFDLLRREFARAKEKNPIKGFDL